MNLELSKTTYTSKRFFKEFSSVHPMRTTCWLVKRNSRSFIKPIREGERKNSLMYKFVVQHFQKRIIIGRIGEQFMIWTNQIWCLKASSSQGVNTSHCAMLWEIGHFGLSPMDSKIVYHRVLLPWLDITLCLPLQYNSQCKSVIIKASQQHKSLMYHMVM